MNQKRLRWVRVARVMLVAGWLLSVVNPVMAASPVTLKVALLPIFDTLPFYVADENGYFNARGVDITALPVGSAVERDQLIQAGAADGAVNEMISVINFNRERTTARVVGAARKSVTGAPLFRILAASDAGIQHPGDLAGVPIGVSMNTIIAYVTDRLLGEAGLSPSQIRMQSDLLMLDEPFSALDAPTREDLQQLMDELLAENALTRIIVTHDIDEALHMGRRILVLGGGRPQVVDNPCARSGGTPAPEDFLRQRRLLRDLLGDRV